jgi:dihydroxyacetone kinase
MVAGVAAPAVTYPPAGPLAPALRRAVLAVAGALEAAKPRLTELDSRAGDGDLGVSMVRAAEALRALPDGAFADPPTALAAMADALRRAIGGSSGPFYATALMRAARELPASPGVAEWAAAFREGVAAVAALGGAKPGDRTMLDALVPAADAFAAAGGGLQEAARAAAEAAERGAEATAAMVPRLGRASYLGARAVGAPDAGAAAVAVWWRSLVPG